MYNTRNNIHFEKEVILMSDKDNVIQAGIRKGKIKIISKV